MWGGVLVGMGMGVHRDVLFFWNLYSVVMNYLRVSLNVGRRIFVIYMYPVCKLNFSYRTST